MESSHIFRSYIIADMKGNMHVRRPSAIFSATCLAAVEGLEEEGGGGGRKEGREKRERLEESVRTREYLCASISDFILFNNSEWLF